LSVEIAGNIHGMMQRAKNLRSDAIEYFNYQTSSRSEIADRKTVATFFQIYESLRTDVIDLFASDATVHSLPSLSMSKGLFASNVELIEVSAGAQQIIGFLEGKVIDIFGKKIRKFPVEEKELDALPSTTKLLILEAIDEYDYNHSYACCCICGLAFHSLVQEGCKKHNLPFEGLARGIGALKNANAIKEDLHKSLIDLEKYYRDKISAHLTSEVATDEKARLFLSSLLSLSKAIFAN
jgi:hypothetical protein